MGAILESKLAPYELVATFCPIIPSDLCREQLGGHNGTSRSGAMSAVRAWEVISRGVREGLASRACTSSFRPCCTRNCDITPLIRCISAFLTHLRLPLAV